MKEPYSLPKNSFANRYLVLSFVLFGMAFGVYYLNEIQPEMVIDYRTLLTLLMWFFAITGAVFSILTIVISYDGLYENRQSRRYPNEPWRWRKNWQNGSVKNDSFSQFSSQLTLAAIVSVVSSGLSYLFLVSMISGIGDLSINQIIAHAGILVVIFVGLFFLFRSVFTKYRLWQLWKNSTFKPRPFPVFMSGSCIGDLNLPKDLPVNSVFTCNLGCYRKEKAKYFQSSRINALRKGDLLWLSEPQMVKLMAGSQYIAPQFKLPKGYPESSWLDQYNKVRWLLNLKGMGTEISYEVPVYTDYAG